MTFGEALLDRSLAPSVEDFLRARRDSDAGYVRDGLRWLHASSGPLAPGPRDALSIARTLATAAWADMSLAFSLWCHRMVIEYVRAAREDSSGAESGEIGAWLVRLERADVAGSSGLAAAMAHHVSGAPLPVKAQPSSDQRLALDGQLRWASNLFDDGFLLVTAADAGAAGKVIVAIPAGRAGLAIEPYPELLDLQATASSSVKLAAAFVDAGEIVTSDFERFIRRVRPTFLLFQASFCWGLAARALFEGARLVPRGSNEVFASELHALETERDRVEAAISAALGEKKLRGGSSAAADTREVVGMRLSAARLAGAATRLECKLTGGAGYAARSATARRLREAAFLPIQSPTEGQLLWELSRSA